MAETYVSRSGLQVADRLARFIEDEVLPGLPVSPEQFWTGAAGIFAQYAPENAALLAERDRLQSEIDRWHLEHKGEEPFDQVAYQAFLTRIGYLVDEPAPFTISPGAVDAEIAERAGPQLVVPVSNARFLLNAANARWGSLYDALYGTDAIAGERGAAGYDPERGAQVITWGRNFLDSNIPLASGSWADWQGDAPVLADPSCLVGRAGANYLFQHNGLHIELVIDANHPIGQTDKAHIADIVLESALTTIADLEDSVAAVDAEDKVGSYANWLGLMRGDLTASFTKGGTLQTRSLAADRHYTDLDGKDFSLSGRSLMFVRNVGHLMTTPAVLLESGAEAPEGILDAIVTSLIALHDRAEGKVHRNSAHGSVYIVKPKMHGPAEVAFANSLFDAVEDMLGLPRHTVKLGLMDEERRTSANLAACIHAVKGRLVFINTGFLDRTGDEIHTSMQAGPMVRKGAMKASRWIGAYEDRNVQIGLACGLSGRAQIGKGMWAAPDRIAQMVEEKRGHPLSGANTAWVPNPTAATLHAVHYHAINVAERQQERSAEPVTDVSELLQIPLAVSPNWTAQEIAEELENNAQGLLGYVVRWVDQGVGCSKVPDINDIGLMEDRATLRISSQHMANWLLHGVVSWEQVEAALIKMAAKVDEQNAGDLAYTPLLSNAAGGIAMEAARALIRGGVAEPNGYTEPSLHRFRLQAKQAGMAAA